MSWKKYFKVANQDGVMSPISGSNVRPEHAQSPDIGFRNYQSTLQDVYVGHPNRVERYSQYESMDADSEVNACLDIIAEFSTLWNEKNNTPFEFRFKEKPSESEVDILKKQLQQWVKLNQLDQRLFKMFRNTIKYGDQVFVRDPETFELFWVDMTKVSRVIVDEARGKLPEQYVIRDINPNFQNLTVAAKTTKDSAANPVGGVSAAQGYSTPNLNGGVGGSRFNTALNESVLNAEHILHLSLSEGLDANWPFGTSILENIFKVFKQKELLEDAILIYRVQRAPERRVFYIDVGNMMPHMAMAFVERVKNEIHQRRIPTLNGGGSSMLDAAYSPLAVHEDYFFPQTCLSLDTQIKLLDGRDLALADIISEYQSGKENFTFTVNQETQKIEPGKIIWAGVTRKDAEVVKITLDNGESVIATPDHRFIMRDGTEKEAGLLQSGDSVMPLYLIDATAGRHQHAGKYLKYIEPATGKSQWVHIMACPKQEPANTVIHHIDCNSRNNNPSNLIEMDENEHRALHASLGTYHLTRAWQDPIKRKKLVDGIRQYHKNATPEDKAMFAARGKRNGAKLWENRESSEKALLTLCENRKWVSKAKTIYYGDRAAARVVALFNEGYDSISKITVKLRNDAEFQTICLEDNPNLIRDKNRPSNICPTDYSLNQIVKVFGYATWGEFKRNYSNNHKVATVEILNHRIDTGDVTIESASGSHNFALSCGIFVHNSEGRGSKVETLPGGDNLGQIDDLKYFNNKLCRGLRVPSSYLPTGPDDQTTPLNDGRVGTAMIQEHRFNQYCQRLQSALITKLDDEFKMFLQWRGFNIDAGLFDLTFTPPQNFASYRQAELDTTRVNVFQSLEQVPYLSKRFMLKRYLGLSQEEMIENEELWREEQDTAPAATASGDDLRSVGVMPGGLAGDIETADEFGDAGDLAAGEMEMPAAEGPGAGPTLGGPTPPPAPGVG
jgi:hypothetical protein